jgi:hypothetical protein
LVTAHARLGLVDRPDDRPIDLKTTSSIQESVCIDAAAVVIDGGRDELSCDCQGRAYGNSGSAHVGYTWAYEVRIDGQWFRNAY